MRNQVKIYNLYLFRNTIYNPVLWLILIVVYLYLLYSLSIYISDNEFYQTELTGLELFLIFLDNYVITYGVFLGFLLINYVFFIQNDYERLIIYRLKRKFFISLSYIVFFGVLSFSYTFYIFLSSLFTLSLWDFKFTNMWSTELSDIASIVESTNTLHPFLMFFAVNPDKLLEISPLALLISTFFLMFLSLLILSLVFFWFTKIFSKKVALVIIIIYLFTYNFIPIEIHPEYRYLFLHSHVIPFFKVTEDFLKIPILHSLWLMVFILVILIYLIINYINRKDIV